MCSAPKRSTPHRRERYGCVCVGGTGAYERGCAWIDAGYVDGYSGTAGKTTRKMSIPRVLRLHTIGACRDSQRQPADVLP